MFSPRLARRSLNRYRRKGLDELERMMVTSAAEAGLGGARVLEIGGGIGALQSELLEAGAVNGEVVELSPAYAPYAEELAHERGLDQRSSFRVADVLADPADVGPAEIVLLNRVVCCSPDGVELAGAAAKLTRNTLVLSFPRNRVLVRAGLRLVNAWSWLLRRSFRVFLHPARALVAAAEAEGLQLTESGRVQFWEFVALRRE